MSIQEFLNSLTTKQLLEIQDNLIVTPVLKNKDEYFEFKVPEIVLQQPDDWKFYLLENGKNCGHDNEYYFEMIGEDASKSFCIINKKILNDFTHSDEIQYMMVRYKKTKKEQSPLEKLTEKVNLLTVELNKLKNLKIKIVD